MNNSKKLNAKELLVINAVIHQGRVKSNQNVKLLQLKNSYRNQVTKRQSQNAKEILRPLGKVAAKSQSSRTKEKRSHLEKTVMVRPEDKAP